VQRDSKTRDAALLQRRGGIAVYETPTVYAWGITLNDNWESYYGGLDKGLRNDTGRQLRRLAGHGDLELVPISGGAVQENLELFFSMHTERWAGIDKAPLFSQEGNREFFRKLTRTFDHKGYLDFRKLMIGDRILAMHLGYRYRNRFYYNLPAFNTEYQKYSVGRILTLELIKSAYAEGFEYFDFMAGDEAYKGDFANHSVPLYRMYLMNHNVRGQLYRLMKFGMMPLWSQAVNRIRLRKQG